MSVIPIVAVMMLVVTSCSTTDDGKKKAKKTAKPKKEEDIESLFNKDFKVRPDRAKPQTIEDETVKADSPASVVKPVDVTKLATDSKGRTEVQRDVKPFYAKYIEKGKETESEIAVSFNDTSIADVVPAFAKALGFNYIIDPAVRER